MSTHNYHKKEYEQLEPRNIPKEYYDFSFYVSKERMITYWHQVVDVLSKKPKIILEVGIGNGIVSNILKIYGIKAITTDINESLRPNKVVSITELDTVFEPGEFPLVLCARVLHHLPFSEFDNVLSQLNHVTQEYLILTLPVETFRIYFTCRITGWKSVSVSIPFPLVLKRCLQWALKITEKSKTQNFWKINSSKEVCMFNIRAKIKKYFYIEKYYQVPEDMSHAFFVLKKK